MSDSTDKTQTQKSNPYHDERGRFTTQREYSRITQRKSHFSLFSLTLPDVKAKQGKRKKSAFSY
jgi:predicted RNA-binding protein with PUA-like domain